MIDVDVSDIVEHGHEAARLHRQFPERMRRILQSAAGEAQQHHAYQNRTGNLEASTQAVDVGEGPDSVTIDFAMAEEYASYVVNRGFSNFPEVEAHAESMVDSDVGNMIATVAK